MQLRSLLLPIGLAGLLLSAAFAAALFDTIKTQEIKTLHSKLAGQMALNQELRKRLAATPATVGALSRPLQQTLDRRIGELASRQRRLRVQLEILHTALTTALLETHHAPAINAAPIAPALPLKPPHERHISSDTTAETELPDSGVAPPPSPEPMPSLTPIRWTR